MRTDRAVLRAERFRGMKLCIDCRWYKPGPIGNPRWADCGHPSSGRSDTSPVDGTTSTSWAMCAHMRNFKDLCGRDAVLFEPKEDRPAGFV